MYKKTTILLLSVIFVITLTKALIVSSANSSYRVKDFNDFILNDVRIFELVLLNYELINVDDIKIDFIQKIGYDIRNFANNSKNDFAMVFTFKNVLSQRNIYIYIRTHNDKVIKLITKYPTAEENNAYLLKNLITENYKNQLVELIELVN